MIEKEVESAGLVQVFVSVNLIFLWSLLLLIFVSGSSKEKFEIETVVAKE